MKKILFAVLALTLILSVDQASAINLDKLAGVVEGATQKNSQKKSDSSARGGLLGNIDGISGKLEEKINKFSDKIEKQLDRYEKKIEKAEKATDRIIATLDSFNSSQIEKYITIAKYVVITIVAVMSLFILLLILVFVQLLKVNCLLRKMKKD